MSCRHEPHLHWLGAVLPSSAAPNPAPCPLRCPGCRTAPLGGTEHSSRDTEQHGACRAGRDKGKHSRSKPNALKYSTEIFHTTYINVCLGPETLLFLEATNDTKPYMIL